MHNTATIETLALIGEKLAQSQSATALALKSIGQVEKFGDEFSISISSLGLEVALDKNGIVTSVHFHSNLHEGFREFPFSCKGLSFASNRLDVRSSMGPANSFGAGESGNWDRFENNGRFFHFLYGEASDRIVMISSGLSIHDLG